MNSGLSILSLPPEILIMIFKAAHPGHISLRRQQFPVVETSISQCTRQWRNIAIDIPELWTRLHIRILHQHFEYIHQYLDRSQSYPLDIVLDCSQMDHMPYAEIEFYFAPIVDILRPCIDRCRQLNILAGACSTVHLALTAVQSSTVTIPHLTFLQLYSTFDGITDADRETHPFPKATFPVLTRIGLNRVGIPWHSSLLGGLTFLSIRDLSPTEWPRFVEFRDLLQSSPALETLVLDGDMTVLIRDIVSQNALPIKMEFLRSLVIRTFNEIDDDASVIIRTIFMPVLHTLELGVGPREWQSFLEITRNSDSPTYPTLRHLAFTNMYVDNGVTADLMRMFPNITDLTLYRFNGTDSFLRLIEFESDRSKAGTHPGFPLWPDLQTITIAGIEPNETLIRAIVLSRLALGRPIVTFRFAQTFSCDSKFIGWLDEHARLERFDEEKDLLIGSV